MLRFIVAFCFCFALTDDDVASTNGRVLLVLTHPESDLKRHIDIMSHFKQHRTQVTTNGFFMAGQALRPKS